MLLDVLARPEGLKLELVQKERPIQGRIHFFFILFE